jgi:hypothetical protein
MMSSVWRLAIIAAAAYLFSCAVPARAQFVYRLGGPVFTVRGLCWMEVKNHFQFRKTVAYPYGTPPYGGGAMYSGFNHGHYPMPEHVMYETPGEPVPQLLTPPRPAK